MKVCTCGLTLLASLFFSSGLAHAACKNIGKTDKPHGANQLVELAEQEVDKIRGTIFWGSTEQRAEDVVVAVYKFEASDSYKSFQQTTSSNMVAGCITQGDGKFSFPGLPDGRYLVWLGTRESQGMNEVYAVMRVRSGAKRKILHIEITPGT